MSAVISEHDARTQHWRDDFPLLSRQVHGKPLVYFDSAATAQRPRQVLQAMDDFYRQHNANVHRGVHSLSGEATDLFEAARRKLCQHINASSEREVIFTRGSTEAINLVAQAYLRPLLQAGDEILISHMEHHSNIVPWQMLREQTGAVLKVIPVTDSGELDLQALPELISERTRMLGLVHVSNALGTINPVREVCALARRHGITTIIDGAQAMPHLAVDVQALGCDFYTMSGHKMYGPTGIGALYGREALLEAMPPWQGGGEMIRTVTFEETTWNDLPAKFEAGTPNIAGAIGLGAAVDYIAKIGLDAIAAHEQDLLQFATDKMREIDGLRIIGEARDKASVVSFVIDGVHPHDLGTIVDHHGFAIRTGHHCTMPLIKRFGLPATARASLALYNTRHEIESFIPALRQACDMLR
ncbi:MAG: cysteine desulfurase [Gammaproteobacteria bacterium]|nr:cysteine desulfurase [Gammaproteobacteria bacterium]